MNTLEYRVAALISGVECGWTRGHRDFNNKTRRARRDNTVTPCEEMGKEEAETVSDLRICFPFSPALPSILLQTLPKNASLNMRSISPSAHGFLTSLPFPGLVW